MGLSKNLKDIYKAVHLKPININNYLIYFTLYIILYLCWIST